MKWSEVEGKEFEYNGKQHKAVDRRPQTTLDLKSKIGNPVIRVVYNVKFQPVPSGKPFWSKGLFSFDEETTGEGL